MAIHARVTFDVEIPDAVDKDRLHGILYEFAHGKYNYAVRLPLPLAGPASHTPNSFYADGKLVDVTVHSDR